MRNVVNRQIKASEKIYFMGLFEKSKNDMKNTWKNINSAMGRVSSLSVDKNFKSPVDTVCIGFQQEFALASFRSNDKSAMKNSLLTYRK